MSRYRPALIAAALLASLVPSPAQEFGAREKILAVADSLVGTTEATGRNDGPVVEAILRSAGAGKGDPYCAAFNFYCYLKAGYASHVPRSAWSPDWVKNPTWTRGTGGKTPLQADAFGIFFASKGRVAHTGLVKKWGDAVLTVEGNTSREAAPGSASDRDGGGVWSKRRLKSQIYAVRNWLD